MVTRSFFLFSAIFICGFIVYSPEDFGRQEDEISENRIRISKIEQIREEDIRHAEMYLPYIVKYTDDDESVIPLALAVMKAESNFKTGAISRKGALGLMQLMPATAMDEYRKSGMNASLTELKKNLIMQPELNVALGVKYLITLQGRLEGIENPDKYRKLVIASYNAGMHRVKRAFKCKGFDCYKYKANRYSNSYFKRSLKSLPAETRAYLENVEFYYKLYKKVLAGQKMGVGISA
jgi:peptidoglycan lytic transglycosylase